MEGAEQQKRRLTLGTRTPRSFAIWWISQAGGFANGQPPLHFLTAVNRDCHPERAAVTEGSYNLSSDSTS
jgi:hypothetical protein